MGEARFTYDVTAVSENRVYVALIHGTDITTATEVAQARSQDAMWSAVLVKRAESGLIEATYVDGKRQPSA